MHRRTLLASPFLLAFAPGAFAQSAETPEGVVRALYVAHLRAREQNSQGVLDSPGLRRRFLTPALVAAIVRSEEATRRAGGLVDESLEFDPITASQEDAQLRDLQIRELSADRDRAIVHVTFTQFENQRVELNYILARIEGGWRIYDILRLESAGRNDGWSVRRILGMRN